MPTNLLLTGGAGYIGSHTAVALHEAGYSPILLDNFSNSERTSVNHLEKITGIQPKLIELDCADLSLEQHLPSAAVIHFAGAKSVNESVANPLSYYQNNLAATINLLKSMRKKSVCYLVFSSSATVYGTPDLLPIAETAPVRLAGTPYGKTKVICEEIIRDFAATWPEFRYVILRYFNPIGAHPSGFIGELPNGTPNNLVPYITQTAIGKQKQLVVFGNDYATPDGTCIRDFIHVCDLASAHVAAIQYLLSGGPSDIFNIGTGQGTTVMTLINSFMAVTGQKLPYSIGPRRPGDLPEVWADNSKAVTRLGWRPGHTIKDALSDAWKWECALAGRRE